MAAAKKKNILQLISEFREKVDKIKKNAENPFHKNKYSTLENVMETIEPHLKELNIDYIQIPTESGVNTKIFEVADPENCIEGFIPYVGATDMQRVGSAITYARRYSLVSMFGLEQEDDDGNTASGHKTKVTVQDIATLAKEKNVELAKICEAYQVTDIKFLTQENKALVLEQLKRK